MRRGLVLGGGGLIGMAYHAGALKALDEWGAKPETADVVVGTSAGAVIGAYLRSGWSPADFYDYAHGRHRDSTADREEQRQETRRIFTPLWDSGAERVRRSIGSIFSVVSSRGYWPGRVPMSALRRLFPAGLYATDETRERLHSDLPQEWPSEELYLCAAELYTGELVPFGRPGSPPAPLPDAVLASTAIPGVFPPVKIGGRFYVDGGVRTATSLDLAAEAGCDAILCVAPLGYLKEGRLPLHDPFMWAPIVVRSLFARTLAGEVREARARGTDVLVIRPFLEDLRLHGTNSMRHADRAEITESGRVSTLRFLERHAEHPALLPPSARKETAS